MTFATFVIVNNILLNKQYCFRTERAGKHQLPYCDNTTRAITSVLKWLQSSRSSSMIC